LSPGDLVTFIKEAADSFQDLSERKKIQLSVISSVVSVPASFDHDKIERIVFNLLSNAFKFTHQGGSINLDLSVKKDITQNVTTFCMQITDSGIGISYEQQGKIFERFFQNDSPHSILNQGSGIGLSITKEFVQLHGGEISVKSTLGKGTTFIVNLPIVSNLMLQVEQPTVIYEQVTAESIAFPDINNHTVTPDNVATVLLIEDNDDFRFYLKDNLKAYYHIVEATNGKEGWQKALSCHPQLIVSDISMPYMDGIELSKKIKADKRTTHIPVILLTAITGEQDQIIGLESGANDYLTKPFNFEILNAKIKNLLLLNRTLKDAYSRQIQVMGQEVKIESSDARLLNSIVQYIEEKLNDPELSVEELSRHVGMSRGSLYHKLLELTGLSPIEYIRSVKLDKAATLLEKSDFNVAQIAYMTGFGTPSYFSKMFKAKFKVQPSEYLNNRRRDTKLRFESIPDNSPEN
jgi:DNA-binding response OmpR family regulator